MPSNGLPREQIANAATLRRAEDESAFRFLARQIEMALDSCPTCRGARVTHYAGSMQRDEGYCELRRCPTCSDGERLGRSDLAICTEESSGA